MSDTPNDDLFGASVPTGNNESPGDQKPRRRVRSEERTTKVGLRKLTADSIPTSEDSKPITLEESLSRLEEIVERIENSEVGLEESISLYAEGTTLGNECLKRLSKLEQRIQVIRQTAEGVLEQTPFDEDES